MVRSAFSSCPHLYSCIFLHALYVSAAALWCQRSSAALPTMLIICCKALGCAPAYSCPSALISCITHWVVNRRTCPPSSPAMRSVASFRLQGQERIGSCVNAAGESTLCSDTSRCCSGQRRPLTLPAAARAQSCCLEQPAHHSGGVSLGSSG